MSLEQAAQRWGALYKHPREGEDWRGQVDWERKLAEVRRVVEGGGRILGSIEPPTWEEFRAYVERLPEGKGGWGFLRYEMLKRAGEEELRDWYDHIVVPVVTGEWDPARAVKEAEMLLLHKGKGDVSTLDNFRGIGLLQHAYKIMEWALMAGMWRKLTRIV